MAPAPTCVNDGFSHMAEYASVGLSGCIGSIDCTHIITEQCEYNLKNNHTGFKSTNTTRTYNLICIHRHHILHSTTGRPGRQNDQTMVRLDQFISSIHDGCMLSDNTFQLESIDDGSREIVRTMYLGMYVICIDGYFNWSYTVPPFTVTSQQD